MKSYLAIALLAGIGLTACRNVHRRHDRDDLSKESRPVSGFTGVSTNGSIDIVAAQGDYNVRVEAEHRTLKDIETEVKDGKLVVRFRDGWSWFDAGPVTVYVSAPVLNRLETHGSGDIRSDNTIRDSSRIDLLVSGSGDIHLKLDCPVIMTETHGNGDITISGQSRDLQSQISGSGDLKARDLQAENVKVGIRGSGDADVFASVSLDASISGSGDVNYRGNPKVTSTIHGSGSISKRD